ncbi:NADP-dependent dehydrogenase [Gemmatimonas aurantiaca T-27]|uniref:NADP-dependent dehydrogenase n=2 Tax=Gemmatimonas aurantiaca TaxID=173480 RepID=C1ACK3_GEMAT|nr:NAD(P)-dependent oxidoreductase [Gemmatimonas aurantiaca]BAH40230.1 NADP-dependent dehydrogenase [Gemmatimonas aurantiaca T-27]
MSTSTIGFIGTGLIGAPMVERLLECGRSVVVWNRSSEKLAPLLAAGATAAGSMRELAEQVDIVCICLTDTSAVEDVLFGANGIASAMRAGQLLVDLSSIAPDATQRMATRLHSEAGARWIDAPVSGGVPAARAGRLIIFAGGEADDIAHAAPVFDALSQRVTHMGANGAGQLTKSCNQQIVACNLMVIAEMLAFAEKSGVDASKLPAALAGGFADSLPLQIFGPRMAANIDTPRLGAVGTFRKDIEQVGRLAGEVGASIPVTRAALERYREAIAASDIGADGDASRLIRLTRNATSQHPAS